MGVPISRQKTNKNSIKKEDIQFAMNQISSKNNCFLTGSLSSDFLLKSVFFMMLGSRREFSLITNLRYT